MTLEVTVNPEAIEEDDRAPDPGRRRLLTGLLTFAVLPEAGVAIGESRSLAFRNLHTGERLVAEYHDGCRYLPDALAAVDHLLRDHRTAEVHPIDPVLLDILFHLRASNGETGPYEVISGYRSPKTNATLRETTSGVARKSLHMEGRAIDVRLTGIDTAQLRRAAIDLGAGGVGYYARSDFVHLDTGRFRTW